MAGARPQKSPFDAQIVSDPWQVESPVGELGQAVVEHLLATFSAITRGEDTDGAARLVLSPQHGYGKTHLIGRLFSRLSEQAICVYVTPWSDPARGWRALLELTAQQLTRGDELPRLEIFIAHLLTELTEQTLRRLRDPVLEQEQAWLSEHLDEVGAGGWLEWLATRLLSPFDVTLRHAGVDLQPSNQAWLKVLIGFAAARREGSTRPIALDWIRARPLSTPERHQLGLEPHECLPTDATLASINARSKDHLSALCQLAGFYAPFLFCFDQTESYGHEPALARAFGHVVSELASRTTPVGPAFPNQMTLVTANLLDWQHSLLPHMIHAEAQRFQPSAALTLDPLDLEHAQALAYTRIITAGYTPEQADAFVTAPWLKTWFDEGGAAHGVRQFLIACQQRWRDHAPSPRLPDVDPIDRLRFEAAALRDSDHLQFNVEALDWLIDQPARHNPRVFEVQPAPEAARYISRVWILHSGERRHFVFEPSNHHKRWTAILNEAKENWERDRTVTVALRTPELAAVPGNWKNADAFLAASERYLRVLPLDIETYTHICAAHRLALETRERGMADLLAFSAQIAERLEPLFDRLLASPVDDTPPDPSSAVSDIVALPAPQSPSTDTLVTPAVGAATPDLKEIASAKPDKDTLRPGTVVISRPRTDASRLLALGPEIVRVLSALGVEVRASMPIEAPQLVRFRLRPKGSTSVRQIASRAADLKEHLDLHLVPLVRHATGSVLVDIPKQHAAPVPWAELQQHPRVLEARDLPLAIPLGLAPAGRVLMADLSDDTACHVLIAGQEGAGKTTLIKGILASLATRSEPRVLRVTLITPDASHPLASLEASPYVSDALHELDAASTALEALGAGIDTHARSADIFAKLSLKGARKRPDHLIIIDGYSQLPADDRERLDRFEAAVERIARDGAPAGLHLLVASRASISSLVASQLPFTVACRVASVRASMDILDLPGAERLLGRGDLLAGARKKYRRAQAPDVTDVELREALRAP